MMMAEQTQSDLTRTLNTAPKSDGELLQRLRVEYEAKLEPELDEARAAALQERTEASKPIPEKLDHELASASKRTVAARAALRVAESEELRAWNARQAVVAQRRGSLTHAEAVIRLTTPIEHKEFLSWLDGTFQRVRNGYPILEMDDAGRVSHRRRENDDYADAVSTPDAVNAIHQARRAAEALVYEPLSRAEIRAALATLRASVRQGAQPPTVWHRIKQSLTGRHMFERVEERQAGRK